MMKCMSWSYEQTFCTCTVRYKKVETVIKMVDLFVNKYKKGESNTHMISFRQILGWTKNEKCPWSGHFLRFSIYSLPCIIGAISLPAQTKLINK